MLSKRLQKRLARAAAKQEKRLQRSEALGRAWKIRDDALWNPLEVLIFIVAIVLGFAFVLGRNHIMFAMELFLPVMLVGVWVLFGQAILRKRAGQRTFLEMFFERFH